MTQHLYTEYFLKGDGQVDLNLLKGNFLSFYFDGKKNNVESCKNGKSENITFDSVSNLATTLRSLGDSLSINCKDAKEVDDLIKGKVKKLYYTGDHRASKITKTINL